MSPDGRWIASALVRPARVSALRTSVAKDFTAAGVSAQVLGSEIWLVDPRTGSARRIAGASSTAWGAVWSPGGERLAFYSDRDGRARLWIWHREGDSLRRVSRAVVRPYFPFEVPRWSPDGKRLLVKLLPPGMTVAEASDLLPGPGPAADDGESGGAGRPSVRVLTSDSSRLARAPAAAEAGKDERRISWTNTRLADLALVDVATGDIERIARRVKPLAYRFSPDGDRVLFTDMSWHEAPGGRGTAAYDLVVLDLGRREPVTVARTALRDYGLTVSWGPAGRRIAYVDSSGAVVVAGAPSSGAPPEEWRELARFHRDGVDFRTRYRPPLWDGGDRLFLVAAGSVWTADLAPCRLERIGLPDRLAVRGVVGDVQGGRAWTGRDRESLFLVTRTRSDHRMGFHRVDLETGSVEPVWQDDVYLGPDFAYFLDWQPGDGVVFVAQDARRPQELWTATGRLEHPGRASRLHPGIAEVPFGESRLLRWTSRTGDSLQGTLLLPPDPGARGPLPLVVDVYPERDGGARLNRFGAGGGGTLDHHLLSTRGYAVLVPDAPFPPGDPVGGLASAVLPAVDRAVELGIADPGRIGVFGHSWGGYAAMALLTRSDRFAAAVVSSGYASLFTDYFQLRPDGTAVGVNRVEGYGAEMGEHPWAEGMRDAYVSQSPLFHLDRVEAPVLLLHGSADRVVPPYMAEEIFVGLRRLDKPVVLATYEGEPHTPMSWSLPNLRDRWQRVLDWWNRWLRTGE